MRIIILLALLGTAFAVPKNGQRIVGGEPTTIENYPFMANMEFFVWNFFWSQSCGGSLLSQTVVLTAAHCIVGDAPSQWRVRLGSSMISSGGSIHPASRLIAHESYNTPVLDNDIAIVHLSVPAVYSNSIGRARIAGANFNLADGQVVYAAGWGHLWSNGFSPQQLHHVDLNVINQELCAERYAYLKTQPGFANWPDVSMGMLCTGILDVGGKDTCQGDSGGPVIVEGDIIVGVTSWGRSCADDHYPGVNARVSTFVDWIVANA